MKTKEELLKYAKILDDLENDEKVRLYCEALNEIVSYNIEKPKETYYKSSKLHDYYIIEPYEVITIMKNGKRGFKESGYDIVGKSTNIKERGNLHFCLGYCNYSIDNIKRKIECAILKDNEELENE